MKPLIIILNGELVEFFLNTNVSQSERKENSFAFPS